MFARAADPSAFQSLFFWIHFYNAQVAQQRIGPRDVSILVFLDSLLQPFFCVRSERNFRFQSLFFWIHFYNFFRFVCTQKNRLFQSLFFWIHFYNYIPIQSKKVRFRGFQSLFFWIHFYNSLERVPESDRW